MTHADRAEALASRMIGALTAGSELLSIELGRRLGLYRTLADTTPTTVASFAEAASISPRYAREWLEQQAAAGIIDVASEGDAETRQYALPGGHACVLIHEDDPFNVMGAAALLTGFALALPRVARAYRTGEGVEFSDFGEEVREGIAALNRPSFVHGVREWIEAMPDIAARLDAGGVVLDAGCGVGWSSIALANAFPAARIVGTDTDAASIAEARGNARTAGLADRITFLEVNATDESTLRSRLHEDYALVTVFEALHDMGEPIRALDSFRGVLADGGVVLVADERVADEFVAPAGDVERLQFAASVLHCLPATLAESASVANGTILRAPTVERWAREAGFDRTERLPIEHEFWQFYRLS